MKDSEIGYYIETPKTKNGKRELPLTERAYQAIQKILKNRGKAQPLIVGGYSNFLFLNREGLPKVAGNYEGMVRGLIKKYNKYHKDKLPNITPHSFRHTYCTNMANRGMNPNTLQYLMGTRHNHDTWLLCTRYISICKSGAGKTGLLISEPIFTTHLLLLVAFSCWRVNASLCKVSSKKKIPIKP